MNRKWLQREREREREEERKNGIKTNREGFKRKQTEVSQKGVQERDRKRDQERGRERNEMCRTFPIIHITQHLQPILSLPSKLGCNRMRILFSLPPSLSLSLEEERGKFTTQKWTLASFLLVMFL